MNTKGALDLFVKWGLMPIKVVLFLIGMLLLPIVATVSWGTSARDESWDFFAKQQIIAALHIVTGQKESQE